MKAGPKPQLPSTKEQRGTWRPDRDGGRVVQLVTAGDPPVIPDYLTPAAREYLQQRKIKVAAGGQPAEPAPAAAPAAVSVSLPSSPIW